MPRDPLDLLARICRCANEHRYATGSRRDTLEDMMHDAVAELGDRTGERADGDYEYAWREGLAEVLSPLLADPLHGSQRRH